LTKLGYRYIYGAAGPNAFDCSGLTSWAWAQAGVSIPHSSSAQSQYPYVPLDQLQPGDLVTYYSPVHHVALYIGNGQIIDASTESKPIFITSVYRGGPDPTGHRVNY
jgi:cell wall-associated NlpC family hydrolase